MSTAIAVPTPSPKRDPITVLVDRPSQWHLIEPQWAKLAERSPYTSFCLGADWIGTWLETFGSVLDIEILRFTVGTEMVGACLLTWRRGRKGPIPITRVFLNTAGEDQCDEVVPEFNDLLSLPGWEAAVAGALSAHLAGRSWDEFVLNGCTRSAAAEALLDAFPACSRMVHTVPSYYLDLDAIRRSGVPFENTLSNNTRHRIRQSLKDCEGGGASVEVERAGSPERALELLDELAALHQARWIGKGHPGAFASPLYLQFHRSLIRRWHARGGVELLRAYNAEGTVGIAYNFVQGGKSSYYQCGFRFSENKRARPGVVTLLHMIHYYLGTGLPEFDLMAGDLQYKRSFSKTARELDWITLRRPTMHNLVIDALHRCRGLVWRRAQARKQEEL